MTRNSIRFAHPETQLLRSMNESFDEACARLEESFQRALKPMVPVEPTIWGPYSPAFYSPLGYMPF